MLAVEVTESENTLQVVVLIGEGLLSLLDSSGSVFNGGGLQTPQFTAGKKMLNINCWDPEPKRQHTVPSPLAVGNSQPRSAKV